jgi:hypothetical protein
MSVRSTSGLFPVEWADLIDSELSRAEPKRYADWVRNGFADADRWLVIPEFGVCPADVQYRGFDLPIRHSMAWGLHELVHATRKLAQQEFDSLRALRTFSGASATSKGRAAEAYLSVFYDLSRAIDERKDHDERADHFASASGVLAVWSIEGPAAAVERMREGARLGGQKSIRTRKASGKVISPEAVVLAARNLGWPNSRYGLYKKLASRFNCSASRIGQILRAKEELRNDGG